jgi:exonuclease III
MKIVSWNINRSPEAWHSLVDSGYDVALLQEASPPPDGIFQDSDISPGEWLTAGIAKRNWRTAIVKLSDKVGIEWIPCKPIDAAGSEDLAVSRMGTIAAARITQAGQKPVLLFSCYAAWEYHYKSSVLLSDASAHRIISDLSSFIARDHLIVVAGDFNILNRYGEYGSKYWGKRYASVFDRMEAIDLPFAGPQYPEGRQADPWPDELPKDSKDVPTYYPPQRNPQGATRQIDFVFCSPRLKKHISIKAINSIEDWGPSDHCRLDINFYS